MSSMFDTKTAEHKYLNNVWYHALVDSLAARFADGSFNSGDAFQAVEHACRKANELLERKYAERAKGAS